MPSNQFLSLVWKNILQTNRKLLGKEKNVILALMNAKKGKAKHMDLYHCIINIFTSQKLFYKHNYSGFHCSLEHVAQARFQKQSYQNFTRAEPGIKALHSAKPKPHVISQRKKKRTKRTWQVWNLKVQSFAYFV